MSTVDVTHYSFRVDWSGEDEEFVATCVEFPSLSWLAATPQEALAGMHQLLAEVIADLEEADELVPEPLSARHYSGKFQLRVGPDLHRQLAREAAEAHLSLNQFVVRKLATS